MPKGIKGFQKGHTINVGKKRKKSTRNKIRISNIKSGVLFKKGHIPYNKGLPKYMQPRFNVKLSQEHKDKTSRTMFNGKIKHHLDHNRKNNAPDNIYYFKSQKKHMSYHKFKRNLVKKYLLN